MYNYLVNISCKVHVPPTWICHVPSTWVCLVPTLHDNSNEFCVVKKLGNQQSWLQTWQLFSCIHALKDRSSVAVLHTEFLSTITLGLDGAFCSFKKKRKDWVLDKQHSFPWIWKCRKFKVAIYIEQALAMSLGNRILVFGKTWCAKLDHVCAESIVTREGYFHFTQHIKNCYHYV